MNQAESTGIAVSLFEIFPLCRKLIFSSLDMKDLNLTKSQLSILFALEVRKNFARYFSPLRRRPVHLPIRAGPKRIKLWMSGYCCLNSRGMKLYCV